MTPRRPRLTRRTMLRGMLGGAAVGIGLPLLDAMLDDRGEALADGSPLPPRIGFWWWGNGNHPDRWTPSETGPDYALTPPMARLAPVKEDILLLTGLEIKVPNTATHRSGRTGLMTGLPSTPDTPTWYRARTIDQRIADVTSRGLRFHSLTTCVGQGGVVGAEGPFGVISAVNDPSALYERLFGVAIDPGSGVDPAAVAGLRRSALDAVLDDARRLRSRVSARDRERMEAYYDNLRTYELQLARQQQAPVSRAGCEPLDPADVYGLDVVDDEVKFEVNRLMARGLAMAFACDMTRVFLHQFTRPGGEVRFLGHAEGHHSLTHFEAGDQPRVAAILEVVMEALAQFIDELRAIPEGDGTLLDNMVLLATSEVSEGRTHSIRDMPMILAGTAGGVFRTGEHVAVPARTNASDLILTLSRRVGLPIGSFGEDAAFSDRELLDILA